VELSSGTADGTGTDHKGGEGNLLISARSESGLDIGTRDIDILPAGQEKNNISNVRPVSGSHHHGRFGEISSAA